jgi:hypothetical protein
MSTTREFHIVVYKPDPKITKEYMCVIDDVPEVSVLDIPRGRVTRTNTPFLLIHALRWWVDFYHHSTRNGWTVKGRSLLTTLLPDWW